MTAPKIEKLLTPYNFTNANNVGRIKYIVIHYVGALGGAWANCHYYASKYLGASAHYFVGFEVLRMRISHGTVELRATSTQSAGTATLSASSSASATRAVRQTLPRIGTLRTRPWHPRSS